jgi:thiosulfate/3-mercaptopyruvate sulfurtransferase
MTQPQLIDTQTLASRLGEDDVVIVDCSVVLHRPEGGGPYRVEAQGDAYRDAHIPGACFADLVSVFADPSARFPFAIPVPDDFASAASAIGIGEGVTVVVYSQASPMWATRMWWLLRYHGFDDVLILDGGLTTWLAEGLPVESGDGPLPKPRPFTVTLRPELLATQADVQASLGDGQTCLVNALTPEAFRGDGVTSYSRPGRIPGSESVPAGSLVNPQTWRYQPIESLRNVLARYLEADTAPVFYCGGGISATVDIFAMALLGRDDVRLYDGSLTEWSANPDLPLEIG